MRSHLAVGEQVVISTRPQARRLTWPAVLAVLIAAATGFALGWLSRNNAARLYAPAAEWKQALMVTAVVLAAAVLVLYCLRRFLAWAATRYVLTTSRIVLGRGWSGRQRRDFPLVAVRHVGTRQSPLQRILRCGNISLDLGMDGTVALVDVPEVERFRAFVLAAIEELPRVPGHSSDGFASGPYGIRDNREEDYRG